MLLPFISTVLIFLEKQMISTYFFTISLEKIISCLILHCSLEKNIYSDCTGSTQFEIYKAFLGLHFCLLMAWSLCSFVLNQILYMFKDLKLAKKNKDTKETFHAKMGTIKDRNGVELTEAEDIKKNWQEYTEEL